MALVQTPIIPLVADWIRCHPGTLSLGQGVVYYPPPPEAIEQIARCLADPNNHKYQAVEGIEPLRAAIATKVTRDNQINLTDRQILVTAGSNMGFLNAILAITQPGDEIILLTPYFFNQEMAITIAGCRPVLVPTDAHYQPQLEAIRAAIGDRTRAVVTVSPNNPTGAVYPERCLREINQLCREHHLYHISDEAYEYFTYEEVPHFSPAAIADSQAHTIALYSLSKAYGFASWRIGYMVLPDHLLAPMMKIQDSNIICPPVVSQYAALGALQAGRAYCQNHLGAIAQVRQEFLQALATLSPRCTVPSSAGAFYLFLKLHTEQAAFDLTKHLIRDYGVAVIPGDAFGVDSGCYVRVAYGALQSETARVGIDRLIRGLTALL